jgi:SAM-dependent methyltransferase
MAKSSNSIGPAKQAFFDELVQQAPPPRRVLEVGSGSGRDADWLEQHGYEVTRTDASTSFVATLRAGGHAAELLNVLTDPIPTGYGLIYASAVFLHFTSEELGAVLTRLVEAVEPGGWLAFTVKEGDGQDWSTEKIGRRFFQYWREPPLRMLLDESPWTLVSLATRTGLKDTWLSCLCRSNGQSSG